MYPWIILALISAAVVFFIDLLIRRKKPKENTRAEKVSLIVHMVVGGPYMFLSGLGMLWGITGSSAETAFGEVLYDVTIVMGGIFFIIAACAMIVSFILRKIGKIKASIWIHVIALAYIITVLTVNYLAGILL